MKNRNLSDWVVALSVVACSAVLFTALALALSGTMLGRPARTLLVNFPEVTGVSLGAQVKYGGAAAGRISALRILSNEERLAGNNPQNIVQVTLALTEAVPPLPKDITVSVAADTLLSDKFLLLSGGTPGGPELADGAIVQGTPPVTIDELARNLDETLTGLRGIVGGAQDSSGDVFQQVRGLLGKADTLLGDTKDILGTVRPVMQDAQALVAHTKGVVENADALFTQTGAVVANAGGLVSENREPVKRTFVRLEKAATMLEQLAASGDRMLTKNEKNFNTLISDFLVTGQNLKVTSTYTEILTRTLARRPSALIWGGRSNDIPTREQILQSSGAVGR